MTDEVSAEVIKKTQVTLGKYVKKPPLTDKLLKKPPFRFLHDVVHAVIKETGFLSGLYTDAELISDNVKEKDDKIAFLNKLINAVKTLSDSNLSVRASKVIAGLEPTNTNLLLQALAKSIDSKVDSNQYVAQIKSGNNPEKNKKSSIPKLDKSKNVSKNHNKDEKASKSSKSSKKNVVDTPKSKLDTPKGSKDRISSRKEDDTKHKTGRRGREEKNEKKQNKIDTKVSPKTDLTNQSPKSDFTEKDSNEIPQISPKIQCIRKNSYTINKSNSKDTAEESPKEITTNTKTQNEINVELENKSVNNENNIVQNIKTTPDLEENMKNLIRPKSARPKSGEMKININSKTEKINQEESKLTAIDLSQTKPLAPPSRPKSSLRPPTVRPSSARPGAPRLRADSALPLQEPVNMGNINVIVENIDTYVMDEDETVVIETAPAEAEVVSDIPTVDMNNKGHLVEQILEQLEEEVGGGGGEGKKRTEIDWEPDAIKNKEATSKDVTQLANLIQNLTKTANPLGKLINYLHEDIEAMHSELQMWINTKKQLYAEIRKQKRSLVESNKPLLSHLEVLNQDIKKQQQEITQINSNILKNNARIKELLCK